MYLNDYLKQDLISKLKELSYPDYVDYLYKNYYAIWNGTEFYIKKIRPLLFKKYRQYRKTRPKVAPPPLKNFQLVVYGVLNQINTVQALLFYKGKQIGVAKLEKFSKLTNPEHDYHKNLENYIFIFYIEVSEFKNKGKGFGKLFYKLILKYVKSKGYKGLASDNYNRSPVADRVWINIKKKIGKYKIME